MPSAPASSLGANTHPLKRKRLGLGGGEQKWARVSRKEEERMREEGTRAEQP